MHFIITISDDQNQEHYRRRVATDDINFVIGQMDKALNVRIRKRRKDAGQPRNGVTQQTES